MTLRSLGYRVVEASDGDEALDRWNRDPAAIDLVLTDMVMPGGVSGLELIERLRQSRPELRAIPAYDSMKKLLSRAAETG